MFAGWICGESGDLFEDGGEGYEVLTGSGGREEFDETEAEEVATVPGRVELRLRAVVLRALSDTGDGMGSAALIGEELVELCDAGPTGRGLFGTFGRTGLGFLGSEIARRWAFDDSCGGGVESGFGGGSGGMKVFSRWANLTFCTTGTAGTLLSQGGVTSHGGRDEAFDMMKRSRAGW
jgi:hypothetical protein